MISYAKQIATYDLLGMTLSIVMFDDSGLDNTNASWIRFY